MCDAFCKSLRRWLTRCGFFSTATPQNEEAKGWVNKMKEICDWAAFFTLCDDGEEELQRVSSGEQKYHVLDITVDNFFALYEELSPIGCPTTGHITHIKDIGGQNVEWSVLRTIAIEDQSGKNWYGTLYLVVRAENKFTVCVGRVGYGLMVGKLESSQNMDDFLGRVRGVFQSIVKQRMEQAQMEKKRQEQEEREEE